MSAIITVATVVFNGENDLEKTIKSIIKQRESRPDLIIDYIIIDGLSADGTVDVIRQYDVHITEWVSEQDKGIYDAMNKAVALAKESYILFLGVGDEVISFPHESLLVDFNNAIFGNVWIGSSLFESNVSRGLRTSNSLHHQALLVHKSVMPSTPFDLNYKAYADYNLNVKLLKKGVVFVHSNDMIGYQMPGGLTKNMYAIEMIDIVNKNFGFYWSCRLLIFYSLVHLKRLLFSEDSNFKWEKL